MENNKWKPKYGERYYIVSFSQEDLYDTSLWRDDELQIMAYEYGVIFKTEKEAIECAEKMLESIK